MQFRFFIFFLLVIGIALGISFWFLRGEEEPASRLIEVPEDSSPIAAEERDGETSFAESPEEIPVPVPGALSPVEDALISGVPFTSQAPFAEWHIPQFQNACEEASLLMAAHWISGKPLTKEVAKEEILALETFEEKRFGTAIDTSIEDTQKILEEYFEVSGSRIHYDIESQDIARAIGKGSVVIIPADGTKLKNPNFRPPGPTRHMLIIIGYDAVTKEFITHDPGTRQGANFRYPEKTLYSAILDYATGDHLPPKGERKVMLVIPKSSGIDD